MPIVADSGRFGTPWTTLSGHPHRRLGCHNGAVELIAVDHPLVAHKVRLLRDVTTDSPTFRRLVDELMTLLAYEATREVRVEDVEVVTPITTTTGPRLSHPLPLVVPILRAGLGMLEGMMRVMPTAEVGFVGMVRDEETLQPFTYAERLPQIMAVPDQIKQVFLNLLTNAADACQRPGGVISVHTRQQGDRVEVVISDTGIGIRPEDMELIFQPFYTTKPEVKGTGLGLSVSYGIIKSHDGEIRVTSRPGEGATFTVALPVRIRPATGESGSITMAANEEPLNKQEDQDQTEGAKWTSKPEP